jgi:hypothetical protein
MFKLGNDGYSMTFENGHTVSARWSSGHYITGRTLKALEISAGQVEGTMATDSVDAEVAVIDAAGKFLETPFNEYDTVIGWQSPNQVLKIMEWAAAL